MCCEYKDFMIVPPLSGVVPFKLSVIFFNSNYTLLTYASHLPLSYMCLEYKQFIIVSPSSGIVSLSLLMMFQLQFRISYMCFSYNFYLTSVDSTKHSWYYHLQSEQLYLLLLSVSLTFLMISNSNFPFLTCSSPSNFNLHVFLF